MRQAAVPPDELRRPRVSICVPNLNTRPFLPERFRTVREQTLQDWELLVYDSYSDDGAWEYIAAAAAHEPRMRAWQGPRAGTPGSWTPCVRAARGEYVYIATSDDTMAPDCLEKLAAALDAHPDCDIAHCRLHAIDENGRAAADTNRWWSSGSMFAVSSGSLIQRAHVRKAPFDGLLHLSGGSVYTSITQLLVRRSLFKRIGYFESTWGSVGDFNWAMRAGLVANTVHVPDTWAGWRVHGSQATAGVKLTSAEHAAGVTAMIDHAVRTTTPLMAPRVRQHLAAWTEEAQQFRTFRGLVESRSHLPAIRRYAFMMRRLGSASAREYIVSRLLRREFSDWVRRRLDDVCGGPVLVASSAAAAIDSNAAPTVRVARCGGVI